MSSIARPPDPCLVAIILIVRSRTGPRLVFHYPPNPLSEHRLKTTTKGGRRISRTRSRQGSRNTDSSSSDESGLSSDEDEEEREPHVGGNANANATPGLGRRASNFGIDNLTLTPDAASPGAADSQRPGSLGSGRASSLRKRGGAGSDYEEDAGSDRPDEGPTGSSRPPWESLLGLPGSVWEKLLSPSRSWHKRRFEVGINDLALIGWPVFVREDGTWRKQRRKKKKKPRAEWDGGVLGHNENAEDAQGEDGATSPDLGGSVATITELTLTTSPTEYKRASTASGKFGKQPDDSLDPEDKDHMTMFNVVFVMDPPLLEYSMRVKEIYENIIKKFAKALKWEQARTDYVWRESQHILQVRRKARETSMSTIIILDLAFPLTARSETSVHNLYSELITQSSLARAMYTVYSSISASKIASVSLSPDVSISLQIPPLTSTPYLAGPTDKAYPGLWLTTADSATSADDPVADESNIPHQVLAKHFALLLLDSEAAIIKDVEASGGTMAPALAHYIRCTKPTKSFAQISASSGIPLSTIQMLASHLVYWRRARAIPPIHQRDTYIVSPNCDLSKLELATIAYQTAFPTLPSLPKMLSALSGTPRPYGSFIPSKDHKETYFTILAWLLRGGWVTQLRTFAWIKVTPEIKLAVETALRKEEVDRYLAKGSTSAVADDSDSSSEDDAHSSSSSSLASHGSGDNTPMPGRPDPHARLRISHKLLDRSTALRHSSLILSPHRASPLESRWLDEITVLQRYWPVFLKYFNGYDALEKIPVRESLKRKLVWHVLARLGFVTGPGGPIELDAREQVLVGVRHW
ncbi:Nitrogen permease regulator 3 [Penicillium canariense]|uniref:Nitrogen permease regulator 3 n=1 Tax=Penicillium canariense TaxID=189055 RepID=A0A9W9HWT5_9EURO|nr:Nitrogen permease regulator 3 [Penicillium canariense]KAJ5160462.1 Nitrogen permease regulator 3 [Penicillium canariense]